jgi:hypothetical protein
MRIKDRLTYPILNTSQRVSFVLARLEACLDSHCARVETLLLVCKTPSIGSLSIASYFSIITDDTGIDLWECRVLVNGEEVASTACLRFISCAREVAFRIGDLITSDGGSAKALAIIFDTD